jgi:hypothetical protein
MLINSPNISGSLKVTGNAVITGSLAVLGGINATIEGTAATASYVQYTSVANKPTLVSGSSQISFTGITSKPTLVSGSGQISFTGITNKPTLVSGSSQVSFTGITNKPTLVSGSSQISYSGISGKPSGIVSSSVQVRGYNIFATTGSNQFNGSQAITGSLTVTGQVIAQTLNVQQVTSSIVFSSGSNRFGNSLSNRQQFTGSVSVTGSLTVNGIATSGTVSGTTNYIGKFTGASTIGNSVIQEASGNIGIGVSPTTTLDVNGTGRFGASATKLTTYSDSTYSGIFNGASLFSNESVYMGDGQMFFITSGSLKMRLNASGNLGLGVTPSAWGSGQTAFQFGARGGLSADGSTTYVDNNRFFNGTSNIYTQTAAASIYAQGGGVHLWYTAPSGTAGNAITFTQAMTLSAAGRLLIGKTNDEGFALDVVGTGRINTTAATSAGFISYSETSLSNLWTDATPGIEVLNKIANSGFVGAGAGIKFFLSINGNPQAGIFGVRETTTASALTFYTQNANSSVLERMRITSGGNVLIGTTTNRVGQIQTPNISVFGNTSTPGNSIGLIRFRNEISTGFTNAEIRGLLGPNFVNDGIISFATNSAGSLEERMRITSGGNVGIGTTSPNAKLEIAGFSSASGLILNYGNASGQIEAINFRANGGANGVIGMQMVSAGVGDLWLGGSSGRVLTLYRDGNVGIGTTSPTSPLSFGKSVYGAPSSEDFFRIKFEDLGGIHNDVGIGQPDPGCLGFNAAAAGYISFNEGTNGERVRIAAGGNVGIGTTGPGAPLELYRDGGNANTTGGGIIFSRYQVGGDYRGSGIFHRFISAGGSNDSMVFTVSEGGNPYISGTTALDGRVKMVLTQAGRLGIGTTGPSQKLSLGSPLGIESTATAYGSNDQGSIMWSYEYTGIFPRHLDIIAAGAPDGTNGGSNIRFFTNPVTNASNSVERMRITSGGLVGIGNDSPLANGASAVIDVGNGSGGTINLRDTNTGLAAEGFHQIYGGDNRMYLYAGGSGASAYMQFYTNDAERMRITSNGNIGIGTTDPVSLGGSLGLTLGTTSSGRNIILYSSSNGNNGLIQFIDRDGNDGLQIGSSTVDSYFYGYRAKPMIFFTNGSVKMTITSGGAIQMSNNDTTFSIGSIPNVQRIQYGTGGFTTEFAFLQSNDGYTPIGASAFNTRSDYRLKEDLKEFNGLSLVTNMKVYDFKWKENEERNYGFLAHELQEVVPYIVTGTKDGMFEDEPQIQGMDASKLVPVLVKAIQELKSENDTLKSILQRNNIS